LRHTGKARAKLVDRLVRRDQPASQVALALAARPHPRAELAAQRCEFGLQRGVEPFVHRRPRMVQLDHAIGGNQLLFEQRRARP
jgi:hypothetical protein